MTYTIKEIDTEGAVTSTRTFTGSMAAAKFDAVRFAKDKGSTLTVGLYSTVYSTIRPNKREEVK